MLMFFFIAGVLGIKVKIMLPHDPTGKTGPRIALPDCVSIAEPKEEAVITEPYSENKLEKTPLPMNPGVAPAGPGSVME